MLHLVRTNSPYTVLILAILTLVLKLQALSHAVLPVADSQHALFGFIVNLLKHLFGARPAVFTLFAILLTFGQALYLMGIASRHRLFTKHTYLPAFGYIVLSSLHPDAGQFTAGLLVNWLLLGAIDTMLHFTRREEPTRIVFNAGFLLGAAAILHFPAILYSLLFVMALLWLRPFKAGEWIVAALGFFTPFYFAVCLLYLFQALPAIRSWPHWGSGLPQRRHYGVYLISLISGCSLLLGYGIMILLRFFYRMPVSVRRGWGAIGTAMVTSVAVCALTPFKETGGWVNMLPPLTLLIIPPLLGERRTRAERFANFVFYFLLLLVVFCQLAWRY